MRNKIFATLWITSILSSKVKNRDSFDFFFLTRYHIPLYLKEVQEPQDFFWDFYFNFSQPKCSKFWTSLTIVLNFGLRMVILKKANLWFFFSHYSMLSFDVELELIRLLISFSWRKWTCSLHASGHFFWDEQGKYMFWTIIFFIIKGYC